MPCCFVCDNLPCCNGCHGFRCIKSCTLENGGTGNSCLGCFPCFNGCQFAAGCCDGQCVQCLL
jgi:hypothetical protein